MVMRIKLIANDEHGSKCLKGYSGRPNAMSRVEVSMATSASRNHLEEQPLTGTVTQNEIRWRYLRKYSLMKPPSREGGEGARIHND